MAQVVMDTSAFLAMLWNDKGGDVAEAYARNYIISAVNAAEVFTRILEKNPSEAAKAQVLVLVMTMKIIPFDVKQALNCADLRRGTRALGLSLGDRACLGLAKARGLAAVTADTAWNKLDLGIEVLLVR